MPEIRTVSNFRNTFVFLKQIYYLEGAVQKNYFKNPVHIAKNYDEMVLILNSHFKVLGANNYNFKTLTTSLTKTRL